VYPHPLQETGWEIIEHPRAFNEIRRDDDDDDDDDDDTQITLIDIQ